VGGWCGGLANRWEVFYFFFLIREFVGVGWVGRGAGRGGGGGGERGERDWWETEGGSGKRTWQFLVVLVELVSEAVGANEDTGLGITDIHHLVAIVLLFARGREKSLNQHLF
jgi:hypothetical protein